MSEVDETTLESITDKERRLQVGCDNMETSDIHCTNLEKTGNYRISPPAVKPSRLASKEKGGVGKDLSEGWGINFSLGCTHGCIFCYADQIHRKRLGTLVSGIPWGRYFFIPRNFDEVLVKTQFCGYCHSDFSGVESGQLFPIPFVTGHEASGVVVDVGPGVTRIQKGDHIIACWAVSCGQCKQCVTGHEYICPEHREFIEGGTLLNGTSRLTDADGKPLYHSVFVSGFAEYAVASVDSLVKIDKDVSFDIAALFGCAVLTGVGAVVNTAELKFGESILVVGLGGVGLSAILGAKAAGATKIIAADLNPEKREAAKALGATHVIDSSKEGALEEINT